MTPQEAAIRLREWYIAFDRYGKGNDPAVKEILEAADVLESTAADLDTLREFTKELAARNEELHKEKLAAVLRVPRWISVEERLPETRREARGFYHSNTVLAFDGVRIAMGYFDTSKDDGEWWFVGIDDEERYDDCMKVTHWMPLPQPPEEEKQNEND